MCPYRDQFDERRYQPAKADRCRWGRTIVAACIGSAADRAKALRHEVTARRYAASQHEFQHHMRMAEVYRRRAAFRHAMATKTKPF